MAAAGQPATPGAPNVVQDVTQAVENAVSGVVPAITGVTTTGLPPGTTVTAGGTTTTTGNTDLAGTLENVITTAAKGSVEKALLSLAPDLQAELIKEWQAGLNRVIIKVSGGTAAPPHSQPDRFRACRCPLSCSALVAHRARGGGADRAYLDAGQLAGVNWLDHGGRIAAASLAIGSVVSSLAAYVTRLISEPEVTKPLTAQLPEKQLP